MKNVISRVVLKVEKFLERLALERAVKNLQHELVTLKVREIDDQLRSEVAQGITKFQSSAVKIGSGSDVVREFAGIDRNNFPVAWKTDRTLRTIEGHRWVLREQDGEGTKSVRYTYGYHVVDATFKFERAAQEA